jgi:hypothetical protein
MQHRHAALDFIQSSSPADDDFRGYLCSYPVFQGIYRMVRR